MWTGRQTLSLIENAVTQLHSEEINLDAALNSALSDAARQRKERSEALRELARIKLDEMTAGRLADNLDAGERRAAEILKDYRARIADATQRRESLQKEVTSAEADRHAAAAAVEAALHEVDSLRAQAEASVQATQEWRDAKAARDALDAVAAEAEKKAAASEAELGAKKKPYDGDTLFAYLWRRRFGTSAYSSGGLVRALDRMVADFIGFSEARLNYAALIEIPLRLREHATAQRAAVEPAQAALSAIERRAMIAAGVETKEKALAEARQKLAALEATVEKKHALMREADASRDALVRGGANTAYNEALAIIAGADSSEDLANLYSEARRTPTTADDAVISRLEQIEAGLAKTEAEIASLRKNIADMARRRMEIEQVRDRFRRSGYDHPQTTFNNEGAISDSLKSVLAGVAGSVLWEILKRGYGSQPARGSPGFGGGTFPFPFPLPGGPGEGSRGGDWRDPSSRGGWSPGGDDNSDAGGFSTGGSF
jgi:chromosome segregation ATPase